MSDEGTTRDVARRCAAFMYRTDRASRALGVEVSVTTPGTASATLDIGETHLNGLGVCHGGYLFALADTAFAFACNTYDDVTVAASASIEFLRPARAGDRLTATASERRRGRRSGVYDVSVRNQRGEEVAAFRGRAAATGKPLLPERRGESDT